MIYLLWQTHFQFIFERCEIRELDKDDTWVKRKGKLLFSHQKRCPTSTHHLTPSTYNSIVIFVSFLCPLFFLPFFFSSLFSPQNTISAGQILLHRFYFRASMFTHKLLLTTMTCLFLAMKVEETPLRLRSLFAVFDRLLKRRAGLDCTPLSERRYEAWSEGLRELEVVVLNKLGFELYVDVPHKFILHFVNYLHPTARDDDPPTAALWKSLNQRCWSTLNDCFLSSRVIFQYQPEVIACAAMYVAANELQLALPHEWWKLFDITNNALYAAAIDIQRLYTLLSDTSLPLDYIPTDADDNSNTNELIVYMPRNRAQLLAQRKKQIEEAANTSRLTSSHPSVTAHNNSPSTSSSSNPTMTGTRSSPMEL